MTTAKTDPKGLAAGFDNLHEIDLEWVARGTALYVKHLRDLSTEAQKLGRQGESVKGEKDAEWLEAELVFPIIGDDEGMGITGKLEIQNRHLPVIHLGLGMLAKNIKAARGTLKPIGSRVARTINMLEEAAQYIEGQFQPRFAEQGELLPAQADGNGKPVLTFVDSEEGEPTPPPAEQVEGLRTLDEAQAE